MWRTPLVLLAFTSSILAADPPAAVRLKEVFSPDQPYRVELKTKLSGRLTLPSPMDKTPQVVPVAGESTLIYDERPLIPDEDRTEKVIRIYRTVGFQRSIADRDQKADIRTEVRRMVVLRSEKGKKAPFSPDGPLLWSEIDLIRSDLFTPAAVRGLLPTDPVKPGDKWTARPSALAEFTDLDPIEEGNLSMEFLGIVELNQRRMAKLGLTGTLKGANEDGPSRQKLDGIAYFDLEASRLSYLKLNGVQELLSSEGKVTGRLEGTYTLTRQASTKFSELADSSLRGLDLKPTAENSLLLYDNPELGIRFHYPRRWRVGVVQGRQLTLEEPQGGGILITIEQSTKLPTAEQYRIEVLAYLKQQKATVTAAGRPVRMLDRPMRVDRFALEAEFSTGKVRLDYAVAASSDGGATIASRLPQAESRELLPDVERLLKSLSLTKKIEARPVLPK